MQLVLSHKDGSSSAVEVNDMTVLNVKRWAPPVFAENGGSSTMPQLADDQSFSLEGVVAVALDETFTPQPEPTAEAVEPAPVEYLSDEQAAALDAAAVEGEAPAPWEDEKPKGKRR